MWHLVWPHLIPWWAKALFLFHIWTKPQFFILPTSVYPSKVTLLRFSVVLSLCLLWLHMGSPDMVPPTRAQVAVHVLSSGISKASMSLLHPHLGPEPLRPADEERRNLILMKPTRSGRLLLASRQCWVVGLSCNSLYLTWRLPVLGVQGCFSGPIILS